MILFMLTSSFFLVNIFIMIVMYEFESARNDPEHQSNDYEIIEHIRNKV